MKLKEVDAKPCPFCGTKPKMKVTNRYPDNRVDYVTGYTMTCVNTKCLIYDADSRYYQTEAKALMIWDRRATT